MITYHFIFLNSCFSAAFENVFFKNCGNAFVAPVFVKLLAVNHFIYVV